MYQPGRPPLLEHAASATLAGPHAQPTLVLTVRANQDADLAIIRRRIRQEAMPRLCQALELSSLPAQVEFHYTAKSQSAVNGRRNRQVGVVDKHEADPSSARRPCGGPAAVLACVSRVVSGGRWASNQVSSSASMVPASAARIQAIAARLANSGLAGNVADCAMVSIAAPDARLALNVGHRGPGCAGGDYPKIRS
jgi:hypothetical protein